ncbi:hypothetical protein GN277_00280 [Lachnospiraceae bacterium WCA-9-b2]|uniref:HTH cro/C1-type domain-containing protein n=1 Tax=Sporofaciens musculi TaxID=2681861 RepID=A0A7X3MCL1_9FIRM|nr:hypothetical protein [Sporofaciens musculi]MXP73934.1 hypothetical protein [Sporofaciens musculi]
MENLKSNIDRYMELKGIRMYSHLLVDIAHELGIKGQEAYKFADKEKSNFSKMLKGERSLKYDFIIPLEKIFGISLARLLYEDAYKLPAEKGNVPFNKGFRYYAYLDDPKLYKDEFDVLLTNDGKSILTQTDEFGKNFLDYVVEYHSVNGVRYLHDEYGIKLKWSHNQFEFRKDKGITWIHFENGIEFARLVASMNDVELFNNIYDSYNMFFTNGHYATEDCIFCQDEYLEIMLDNDDLFNSIFEIKPYELKMGNIGRRKKQVDSITYRSINPIINNCLRYALKHLDKYKHKAIDILKFGINYNRRIDGEVDFNDYYVCNELGGLKNFRNEDYYDIIIIVDVEVNDDEVKSLINRLLEFNKLK